MAAELKATNPAINVEILGVNMPSDAAFNDLVTAERRLPWLQDDVAASAWDIWGVTWRDVRILDAQNRLVAVYNLTLNDLTQPTNRARLMQLFLAAARFVDTDGDRLLDDWEMINFGNLSASPTGDPDADGQDNFTEYAFGTNPTDAQSKSSFIPALTGNGSGRMFSVSFGRRAGSAVDYVIESSPDLISWSATSGLVVEPFRNNFDGTGLGRSACTLVAPVTTQPRGFLRVRATPSPGL